MNQPAALSLCFALGATAAVAAQAPGPRHVTRPTPRRELRLDPGSYHQDRFLVKFRDDARVRLRPSGPAALSGAQLASSDGLDLSGVVPLLARNRIERVFTRPVADLDRERAAIAKRFDRDPRFDRPADLNNFYRVYTAGRAETRAKIAALLRDPSVETAYPEFHPGAILPAQSFKRMPSDPSRGKNRYTPIQTPFFEPRQTYLGPAPAGLGFEGAQSIFGAQGNAKQVICHIEAAWTFGHEDTPQLTRARILGSKNFYWFDTQVWRDHGTAIVGLLTAARDGKGVRGFVPNSRLYVVSLINKFGNAVSIAAAKAGPGDVFTSSAVEGITYKGKGYHAPLDFPQDAYDAIRNAVLKGIVVVLAGGNTGADLATKDIYGTRYLPSSTPSGAIITGATLGPATKRVAWSNFGQVFRANAWGSGIYTCGYGHAFRSPEAPDRRSYTSFFGGTSAAAPQVAGVLAAVQSAAVKNLGKPFSPQALAAAMRRFGTTVRGSIGVRPNMLAMMRGLGILGGLRAMNEVAPGHKLTLGLELRANEAFILLGAVSQRRIPWPGLTYPFLVDPQTMVIIVAGTMPVRSPLLHDIPLPHFAFLEGARLYYQGVRVDLKTKTLDLTNSTVAWLRHDPRMQ